MEELIKKRLSEAIKHCQLTQNEIAKQISITQSCIAHYVNGDAIPSLQTFAALCKVIDADANYILGIED